MNININSKINSYLKITANLEDKTINLFHIELS